MVDVLLGVLIGVFIGWHVPQPVWVKEWTDWFMSKIKSDEETK